MMGFPSVDTKRGKEKIFRPTLGKGENKMNNSIFSGMKHGSPKRGMTLGSQQHITSKDVASYCMVRHGYSTPGGLKMES